MITISDLKYQNAFVLNLQKHKQSIHTVSAFEMSKYVLFQTTPIQKDNIGMLYNK